MIAREQFPFIAIPYALKEFGKCKYLEGRYQFKANLRLPKGFPPAPDFPICFTDNGVLLKQ